MSSARISISYSLNTGSCTDLAPHTDNMDIMFVMNLRITLINNRSQFSLLRLLPRPFTLEAAVTVLHAEYL
jgi:hypothetical protein